MEQHKMKSESVEGKLKELVSAYAELIFDRLSFEKTEVLAAEAATLLTLCKAYAAYWGR